MAQASMEAIFCYFCSSKIPTANDTTMNAYPWLRDIRVVCPMEGSDCFVSGVGRRTQQYSVIAPKDPNSSHTDEGVETTEFLLHQHSSRYWMFGIHERCWRMLILQNPAASRNLNTLSRIVYNLLFSANVEELGQEYIHSRDDLPISLTHADPSTPLVLSSVQLPTQPFYDSGITYMVGWSLENDIFSKLPNELILGILRWTSCMDITRLRLASRVMAEVARPSALPQAFWRSRFYRGNELAFAYRLEFVPSPIHPDWRERFFKIREGFETGNDSLLNRFRVWRRIAFTSHRINKLLEQGSILHGNPTAWERYPITYRSSKSLELGMEYITNRSTTPRTTPRHISCLRCSLGPWHIVPRGRVRELNVLGLVIPDHLPHRELQLGISTIRWAKNRYVTGLRLLHESMEPRSLGLIIKEREEVIPFWDSVYNKGIEVFWENGAFTDLKACGEGYDSQWLWPQMSQHSSERAIRLQGDEDRPIQEIVAGFDGWKMTSIALVTRKQSDYSSASSTSSESSQKRNFRIYLNPWLDTTDEDE